MFKVSGATVYPSEVERAVRTIDGVRSACVTDAAGQVGAAVVCAGQTVGRLRSEARQRLSTFKVPTVWVLLDSEDDVPRGSTGKVDVGRLRALLSNPPATGPAQPRHV